MNTVCVQVDSKPGRYWKPEFRINGQNRTFPDEKRSVPQSVRTTSVTSSTKARRNPSFVYYPMMLTHSPFVTTPDSADRSSTATQQNFEDMVAYMDKLVGRIVDKLDEAGVLDNTLILFTGDNGSPGGNKGGIRSELNGRTIDGGKGKPTDAGTRVALVASMPGTVPRGKVTMTLSISAT